MKFLLIAFALIAAVAADVSHLPSNEYLPPVSLGAPIPTNEYLPPVQNIAPAHELSSDGYHYKTQRRVVYRRNRRDVSHLPSNEYLPPVQQGFVSPPAPKREYLPPVQSQPQPIAPVIDAPVPVAPVHHFVPAPAPIPIHIPVPAPAPVPIHIPVPAPAPVPVHIPAPAPVSVHAHASAPALAPGHELKDDGYHYKTNRRVVYRRHRRDVSHLASNEYLPPTPEIVPIELAPIQEVSNAVFEDAAPGHELSDDGYHYKTHRRVVYRRNRRDVSQLSSNDYLPPVQENVIEHVIEHGPVDGPVDAPVAIIEEVAPGTEVGTDGYRYKTQRRVVYRRNRRDVSHLPSNEYLPPVQQEVIAEVAPVQPIAILDEAVPAHELADDGYHYKTQRRVVYRRNRRDVSHLPFNEYLPPVQQEVTQVEIPTAEYIPPVQPVAPVPAHELADDGYHYKTQRRVVYRRH